MKKIIVFLQLCVSTLILAACSNAPSTHSTAAAAHSSQPINPTSGPHHIALLLPTTGPLAPYATAIRNGFFTAYYQQKSQAGYSPTITVYNTFGKNIDGVYQAAVAQGADFIVGPLDKPAVARLANNHTLTTPVLALNATDAPPTAPHFFEFALSPTDEAKQAALKIIQDHHHAAIILAPNNAWGQRLANAFSVQLKTSGGVVVGTQFYGSMATLAKNIREVLQISAENKDEQTLKNALHEKMRFMPQRRHDFDSLFLVATPAMAQQIQPLLRFYFAGDIPIYTTSQIHSLGVNTNRDLDGIAFCDMPWILSPAQMQPSYLRTIQQNIQTLWPNNYNRLAKFYAMGVDAFDLTLEMNKLQAQPSYGMPGATGTLFLTPEHTIYRQLMWAKIQNGTPQVI